MTAPDDARARIQRLLVTGDNRLKQGVDPQKARQSYEQALDVAREAGLEEAVRPLVEFRLADLDKLGEKRLHPLRLQPDVVLFGGRPRHQVRSRQQRRLGRARRRSRPRPADRR